MSPVAPAAALSTVVEQIAPNVLPDEACAAFLDSRYCILLDSAGGLPELSRYSYLTADPFLVLTCDREGVTVAESGETHRLGGDPFDVLDRLLQRFRLPAIDGLPPFQGGAAGYWSYELGRFVERLPGRAVEDLSLPWLLIGFYDWVLAHDHLQGRSSIIATGLPARTEAAARNRISWVQARLSRRDRQGISATGVSRPSASTFARAEYEAAVGRVKDYIAAGDVYQVNLSHRMRAPLPCHPWPLYRRLRRASPAPYGAYLQPSPAVAILSASPERFLSLDGRMVESRPIKGTRPRGATPFDDSRWRADLEGSAKDRAENLMIVDLLRNDLGRVCRPGSVQVPSLFAIEAHPTVWQQVSVVTGILDDGAGAADLLRACFPGGSVTGAPKIRAMEIIDELEPVARGVYCGAIGYVGFDGSMETSIPIRTIVVDAGAAYVNVGGGIVADSDPRLEYEETLHKARGALRALESIE